MLADIKVHKELMGGLKHRKGRLEGKRVFITGSHSGIGRATVDLFQDQGCIGFATDNTDTNHKADLTDASETEAIFNRAYEIMGGIDVLVCIAGGMKRHKSRLESTSIEDWKFEIDANLITAMMCVKFAIPELKKSKSASIIFTSSVQAVSGHYDFPAYTAAKSALIGLTRHVARQYAPIRCNCVSPGLILTEAIKTAPNLGEMIAVEGQHAPLGICGVPLDIAYLNLFLASDESSFITGQNFICDGGSSMRGSP